MCTEFQVHIVIRLARRPEAHKYLNTYTSENRSIHDELLASRGFWLSEGNFKIISSLNSSSKTNLCTAEKMCVLNVSARWTTSGAQAWPKTWIFRNFSLNYWCQFFYNKRKKPLKFAFVYQRKQWLRRNFLLSIFKFKIVKQKKLHS